MRVCAHRCCDCKLNCAKLLHNVIFLLAFASVSLLCGGDGGFLRGADGGFLRVADGARTWGCARVTDSPGLMVLLRVADGARGYGLATAGSRPWGRCRTLWAAR